MIQETLQSPVVNRIEHANFLRNAFSWTGSITPKVIFGTLVSAVYCLFVVILHNHFPNLDIDIGPFEYSGVALGLLLVFRVNSGYDRWWEARKLWGSVVNQSRNLALIGLSYSSAPDEWRRQLVKWTSVFSYTMKDHLRAQKSNESIGRFFGTDVAAYSDSISHAPLWVSINIAKLLDEARTKSWLDPFSFQRAERERAILIDDIGACERILKTPIPFVLAVKLKRFIFLFLLLLPFALVSKIGLIAPLLDALIAYPLLSLDQIGFELQNPFSRSSISHLPLDEICEKIEQNIAEVASISSTNRQPAPFL